MMNTPRKSDDAPLCALCGGDMIAVEIAGAENRMALIGDNSGKYFSRDALVPLERAHACLQCGHVELFVDAVKLRRRIAKKP